ncbi:MAG: endolytic transglycosylase MltG [bacterium]|nr:endolytic transglycosylase MltG [Acidimicrobiia bacterium]MCY4649097.1 endolytic transglycosylase MltG [bacterium]
MSSPPDPDQFPRRSSPWSLLRLLAVAGIVVVSAAFVINLGSRMGEEVAQRLEGLETSTTATLVTGRAVEVDIPFGSSATRVAEILMEAGVIADSGLLLAAVQDAGVAGSIQAGTYQLTTGISMEQLLVELLAGPVATTYRITVFAGLRIDEILDLLAEASRIEREQFENALLNQVVTSVYLDQSAPVTLRSWEGLLFPDTYEFDNDADAPQILQRLSDTMEQRMSLVDWSGIAPLGFTPYQGIVMASMIESEVRLAEERPLVASVIFNRLGDGTMLQMDSTVLYALDTRDVAEFDPQVDSPYNTYRHSRLPPAPISAPSFASLQAAAQPAATDFRYFVLASAEGRHTFSVTFEEHQAAIEKSRAEGVLP